MFCDVKRLSSNFSSLEFLHDCFLRSKLYVVQKPLRKGGKSFFPGSDYTTCFYRILRMMNLAIPIVDCVLYAVNLHFYMYTIYR